MSIPINHGGPAFPAQPIYKFPNGAIISLNQGGMTLRDYFAGQALTGYISVEEFSTEHPAKLATWSYEQADAMLAAREAKL